MNHFVLAGKAQLIFYRYSDQAGKKFEQIVRPSGRKTFAQQGALSKHQLSGCHQLNNTTLLTWVVKDFVSMMDY